jgi:hypothetical protein
LNVPSQFIAILLRKILKPILHAQSTECDEILNRAISCITGIECSEYFNSHIGKRQSDQKNIVKAFQNEVAEKLSNALPEIDWDIEFSPSKVNKDSIDVFGKGNHFVIAIELDKNRADQVAKKFVSRVALLPNTKIYFISLCYPGTDNMSKPECIKYFSYCSSLAKRMDNDYAGFVIE